MEKDDLERVVIQSERDIKWIRDGIREQQNKIDNIEKTLKDQCVDIKNIKTELSLTPSRVAKEVRIFLGEELEKRDEKINNLEKKVVAITILLGSIAGGISSRVWNFLFP